MNAPAFTSQIRPTSGCARSTGLSHAICDPLPHPPTRRSTNTSDQAMPTTFWIIRRCYQRKRPGEGLGGGTAAGVTGPRGTRSLPHCGWAPPRRVTPVVACWERVRPTPAAVPPPNPSPGRSWLIASTYDPEGGQHRLVARVRAPSRGRVREGVTDRVGEPGGACASAGGADLGREGRGVHQRGDLGLAAGREPIRNPGGAARQPRSSRAPGEARAGAGRGRATSGRGIRDALDRRRAGAFALSGAESEGRRRARRRRELAALGLARIAPLPADRPGRSRREFAHRRDQPVAPRDRGRSPQWPDGTRPGARDAAPACRAFPGDAERDGA